MLKDISLTVLLWGSRSPLIRVLELAVHQELPLRLRWCRESSRSIKGGLSSHRDTVLRYHASSIVALSMLVEMWPHEHLDSLSAIQWLSQVSI